jgi:glucuronoarabinoxylan endo-1,4-beta-xylanase
LCGLRFVSAEPDRVGGFCWLNKAFESVQAAIACRNTDGNLPKMIGPETVGIATVHEYIANFVDHSKFYAFNHHMYERDVGIHPNAFNVEMKTLREQTGSKPLFQTEYQFLKSNNNTALVRKLNLARLMHNVLTVERASAYLYWALYWPSSNALVDISDTDNAKASPEYFAFKHFSAFIHSGWSRIGAWSDKNNPTGLFLSAYTSPDETSLSVVIINESSNATELTILVKDLKVTSGTIYQSSETKGCEPIGVFDPSSSLQAPSQSISTLLLRVISLSNRFKTE